MLTKKDKAATSARATAPKHDQRKQFYQGSYRLASLKTKIGSILLCLQGTAERDQQQDAWSVFADCLSYYIDLKYGRTE
ncbi:MAG: hypothetical protein H8D56_05395 [Planctomycetes bacterium]|nr:hypothetical protein [Planctomycetota bacterium]MBL7145825.1 hypothetical protein [Phycisphaerae bacterium]